MVLALLLMVSSPRCSAAAPLFFSPFPAPIVHDVAFLGVKKGLFWFEVLRQLVTLIPTSFSSFFQSWIFSYLRHIPSGRTGFLPVRRRPSPYSFLPENVDVLFS